MEWSDCGIWCLSERWERAAGLATRGEFVLKPSMRAAGQQKRTGSRLYASVYCLESKSLALDIGMCQNGGLFSFAGHNAGATKATQNEPLSIPVNNPIAVPHIIPYVTPFNEFRLYLIYGKTMQGNPLTSSPPPTPEPYA